MRVKHIFIIFISIFSLYNFIDVKVLKATYNESELIDYINENEIYNEAIWHGLNFYNIIKNKSGFTSLFLLTKKKYQIQSEVLNNDWFLSPIGNISPADELIASIKNLFNSNSDLKCKHAGKYLWLKYRFKNRIPYYKFTFCAEFNNWFQRYKNSDIYFLSISSDIKSTSTMFGHNMLMIGHKNYNYIRFINYGVPKEIIVKDWPIFRQVKGLSKMYYSNFGILEYDDIRKDYIENNRKIDVYKISLNQHEKEVLLAHIWSIIEGYTNFKLNMNRVDPESVNINDYFIMFKYGFILENCSYQIFNLIQAVKPKLRLHFAKLKPRFIKPQTVFDILKKENVISLQRLNLDDFVK